jgi:hypothetical protein
MATRKIHPKVPKGIDELVAASVLYTTEGQKKALSSIYMGQRLFPNKAVLPTQLS